MSVSSDNPVIHEPIRRFGLLCVPLFAAIALGADEPEVMAPVLYDSIEDVVYGQKDGMGLTLDVLTPKKDAKGVGIILVSSGGWRSSKSNVLAENEKRKQEEHWIQGLLRGGYTIFLARHGSTPRYFVPEMIEDIRRSVRFVRCNAGRFHIDPNRIGITSGSSGGHLALMVGLTGDDGRAGSKDPVEQTSCRVQAIVAWFAPTDLVNFGMPNGYKIVNAARPEFIKAIFGKVEDMETQLRSISPIEQITSDDPPVLMIHGDKDRTVPLQQSKIFAAKYESEGLPVRLIVHAGGGHTYWPGILDQYPDVWDWFDTKMNK